VCAVLPSSSEEGLCCALSRCRGSSVAIVTKLRAGLSRNRSIPGGVIGRRQVAVAPNTAVKCSSYGDRAVSSVARENRSVSVQGLCLVALTGR